MTGRLHTAGEVLAFSSAHGWVDELIVEGAGGALAAADGGPPTVWVDVESHRHPFATEGWELLARGIRRRANEVVVENVITSGFDLHLGRAEGHAVFTYRWRPPARDRVAARVLRSRFHLLARAALLQYPALWSAGTRGRAPLHASGCAFDRTTALVTGQSGIGRSSLVVKEVAAGAWATGDNLAVGDGETVWGLVEPARVSGASGRKMPHGRTETVLSNRIGALNPQCIVVLVRGAEDAPRLSRCDADVAARALVASTYMAGELRRYWSFAAALSTGTGCGTPHPPVERVATAFTDLPCFLLALGQSQRASLPALLDRVAVPV